MLLLSLLITWSILFFQWNSTRTKGVVKNNTVMFFGCTKKCYRKSKLLFNQKQNNHLYSDFPIVPSIDWGLSFLNMSSHKMSLIPGCCAVIKRPTAVTWLRNSFPMSPLWVSNQRFESSLSPRPRTYVHHIIAGMSFHFATDFNFTPTWKFCHCFFQAKISLLCKESHFTHLLEVLTDVIWCQTSLVLKSKTVLCMPL